MLSSIIAAIGFSFVAGLVGIVAFKLLNGDINTHRLLADKLTKDFSPARLQLLAATVGGAAYYFNQVLGSANSLPPAPNTLLVLVGGSNAAYLGAKIYSRFLGPDPLSRRSNN